MDSYCCESTGLYIPAATVLSVYVDEASVCVFLCVCVCVLILSFQANWVCSLSQLEVTKYANPFIVSAPECQDFALALVRHRRCWPHYAHVHIFFRERDYQRWRLTMILATRLVQVKEFDLGLNADERIEEKAMHL